MRRRGLLAIVVLVAGCGSPVPPSPGLPAPSPPEATPESTGPTQGPIAAPTLLTVAGRAAHTATAIADGSVFVAGGCVVDGCTTATDETFLVLPDGSVRPGPPMSAPRDGHTATLLQSDGVVVLVGGFPGEGRNVLDSIDIFEPAGASVVAFQPLAVARGGHAAAVVGETRVLVVGGWVGPRTYTASAEIIDHATSTATEAAPLPWAADALEAVTLHDGRVLVTGGQVASGSGTDRAAIYDPLSDRWQDVGAMGSPRFKHAAVVLGDGRVLVIGGTTDDVNILRTTEIFDSATNRFTPGPELLEPRYKLAGGAALVGDGQVLVAGGGASAELVDVEAGTSRIVERYSARGSFATVTSLGAAEWLVLGGYDDRIRLRRAFDVLRLETG